MRNITQMLVLWFGSLMVLVVLGLAIALIATDFYSDRLFGTKRTGFIVLLIAYAVYRSYRTYSIFKSRKRHDN